MKPSVYKVNVVKVNNEGVKHCPDLVSVEEPLEIRLTYGHNENRTKKTISITMRTPGNDFELALGFLFSENIISSTNQIENIRYCTEPETEDAVDNVVIVELKPRVSVDLNKLERHFYTTSSCGVCGKTSIEAVQVASCTRINLTQSSVSASVIHQLPIQLKQKQSVFAYTGGLHGCALFTTKGELLLTREDVGRHNALDKLIGAAISNKSIDLGSCILQLSGRISFELVQKAAMAAIPVVAAVGAPSSLAVRSANDFGITLIGFSRDERFNIYTHKNRLTLT
ncbi:MAG: formate dehydrogenase accessory sulfurtransferase FdhD [Bacteroidia bacterium]